ncbi:hypothetical protein AALB53_16480 [Lachnospiraceae bacterium 47-T17]
MNKMEEAVLISPISERFFAIMLSVWDDDGDTKRVAKHFGISVNEVIQIIHEELFIPGMETRMAWQAMCFVIVCLDKKEMEETLRKTIKKCILMAAVFYTNVPENVRNDIAMNGSNAECFRS